MLDQWSAGKYVLVSDPSTVKPDDVLLASQDVRFPKAPAKNLQTAQSAA
jgi:hypothetical protein